MTAEPRSPPSPPRYTVLGTGDILVDNTLTKTGTTVELPRVGMNLVLPDGFDGMTWFGRGPFENYWDRKSAAFVGRYSASVASQYVPYVRPQENGNKTDVRWVALTSDTAGLLAVGAPVLEVEAHHNRPEDFETPGAGFVDRDQTLNRHISDIVPRPFTWLALDLHQMGVGGDDSWGAWTHDQYRLTDASYSWSYRLRGFDPRSDDPAALARQAFQRAKRSTVSRGAGRPPRENRQDAGHDQQRRDIPQQMRPLAGVLDRHHQHERGMDHARPNREPEQRRVLQRVARTDDQKHAERSVNTENHGEVMGRPHAPGPAAGPNLRQGVNPDHEDQADDDHGKSQSGDTGGGGHRSLLAGWKVMSDSTRV